jgi:3-dehydrosphinganine reductase
MVFGYYWASAFLALFIAFLALDIMGLFSRKNYLDVDGKVWLVFCEMGGSFEADMWLQTVLLTGGSTGMGRGVAKILAQKGANIVIVARNQGRLAEALAHVSVCDSNAAQYCRRDNISLIVVTGSGEGSC